MRNITLSEHIKYFWVYVLVTGFKIRFTSIKMKTLILFLTRKFFDLKRRGAFAVYKLYKVKACQIWDFGRCSTGYKIIIF